MRLCGNYFVPRGTSPFDHVISCRLITFHEVCIVSSYCLRKIKNEDKGKRMLRGTLANLSKIK